MPPVSSAELQSPPEHSAGPRSRFARAFAAGFLAAAVAGCLDASITGQFQTRFAPLALLSGVAVGWAVRLGASGLGGLRYQILAVALAYLAIMAGHAAMLPPELLPEALVHPSGWLLIVSLPFLRDLNGIFELGLILLGLLYAWRLNREPQAYAAHTGKAPAPDGPADPVDQADRPAEATRSK